MKATINSLVTTVDRMATVVNSLTTTANNNFPRDQTVKGKRVAYVSDLGVSPQKNDELDFQERKFKDCIYKAIQYYKTNDSAQGVYSNWNALGVRTINPPPKYNVEYVKTKVTDHFLSLDPNKLHGTEDPDVPREHWFEMWGNLAYDNTFHIIKKFLIVYLGERFGADGVTWNALKVNEQDDIQYMLERIVFYWNQHSGEAGIPSQSGRHFELTAPVLVAPLYLATKNWMVRGMVCSLMGNARKNQTTSVANTMSMTDHMTMLRMNSSFSATSEQPVVPIALEQSAVSVSLVRQQPVVENSSFQPVILDDLRRSQSELISTQVEEFSIPATVSPLPSHSPSPSPSPSPPPVSSPSSLPSTSQANSNRLKKAAKRGVDPSLILEKSCRRRKQ
ncbi:hypothetical protein INT47_006897 [Mucor saturninus]|uniref:Uncharacterized protein n=1 Tax=Mucor saturninus TaxID=64648 RepID=A0A8H7RAK7_9FUNG|nr:hypothetical protein INT47_006897 [Mucor saturninus]